MGGDDVQPSAAYTCFRAGVRRCVHSFHNLELARSDRRSEYKSLAFRRLSKQKLQCKAGQARQATKTTVFTPLRKKTPLNKVNREPRKTCTKQISRAVTRVLFFPIAAHFSGPAPQFLSRAAPPTRTTRLENLKENTTPRGFWENRTKDLELWGKKSSYSRKPHNTRRFSRS